MRDSPPPLTDRVYRKLRRALLYPAYRKYIAAVSGNHPLAGVPTRLRGDAAGNPEEFFDHYDAFASWVAARLQASGKRLKTLDLGSVKMMNGMLSSTHDVTSLVLADCGDQISKVTYVRHDVANPLPFPESSFDVFTSMVSLPLIGLGRYGDKLDPFCLVRLIAELDRVMKPDSTLLVSMCLGPNILNFNNGWFLDLPTIKRLFSGWTLVDQLVDQWSSPRRHTDAAPRFTSDTSLANIELGDYRVVFLRFERGIPVASSGT
jgi:SAM-dependent methyltransferase